MNEKSSKKFYVYKLIDPISKLPFYIGKGSGDRIYHHERQKDRMSKKSSHNNMLLKNKINKVLRESGHVRYQKHYVKNEQCAFDIEIALVKKYGRRDIRTGILCNMTDGGDGVSGYERSEQWKRKHREAAHANCRKIDQYTNDGEFIKTWNNFKEIITHIPNFDTGTLSKCCSNKNKSHVGFRWTWHGEILQNWNKPHKPHKPHKGKMIYQFTLEGEFIKSYQSATMAAKSINKTPTPIREVCAGRGKHAGGYYWSYEKQAPKYKLKVHQYDENGDFVKSFVSIRSASKHTNLTYAQIKNALKNPKNKGGGFFWRRNKFDNIKPHIKKTTGKPVSQFTKDGKFIKTFPSVKQAIEQTNIKGISNCVLGLARSSGGYIWKYSTS